jgi:prolyl-tRNA editing enzyme YbaK/EbsC (Cys-tRNA(Pro) deacylase)
VQDALAVHRDLLARGVPHEIVRLDRVILNAEELPEALGLPAQRCVTVRMYAADDVAIAVCVPAGTVPAPGALLHATGARRVTPATPDWINTVTDFAAGLVAPTLLPKSVAILADSSIAAHEVVYTATGDSGTALGIHAADLLRMTGARVGSLLIAPSVAATVTPDDVVDLVSHDAGRLLGAAPGARPDPPRDGRSGGPAAR